MYAVLQMENSYNALLVALDANQDEDLLPPEGYIPPGPITPEGKQYHCLYYESSVHVCQSANQCSPSGVRDCGCNLARLYGCHYMALWHINHEWLHM